MCKIIQEKMKNLMTDDKTIKLLFWVMVITFIMLALRPSIMIIGSGNGNGSGSGDGNNVFKIKDDQE